MGRRFKALVAVLASQREQPQAGAVAHLRMGFVDQLMLDDLPDVRADTLAPVEQALRCPVAMGLVRGRHAEMVFIVGQRCRHLTPETARTAIFGYCVGNDVSVRDWQLRTSQFTLGKSFDTHAPFGPWIVTADDVVDPHQLGIKCFVNDEKRQDSNTNQLIFDCFEQIEHLSKVMTLEPGDVIFTGTPGGIGGGFKPARWLRKGDRIRVEINGLGAIENVVRAEV